MTDAPDLDLIRDKLRRDPTAHLWWARRGQGASLAVLLLTNQPESGAELLQQAALDPGAVTDPILEGQSVMDLCSGVGTVAAAAQRLGARVTAVDNHPIPALVGEVALRFPCLFGEADAGTHGSADDSTWAGLGGEVDHWSRVLVDRAKEAAGRAWLEDIAGLIRCRVLRCAVCGHEAPVTRTSEIGDAFVIDRGEARCPACGQRARPRQLDTGEIATRLSLSPGRGAEPAPAPAGIDITEYTRDVESRLESTWVVGTTPMSFRDAVSPRQAQLLRAIQDAFRSIRDELADTGYEPAQASAILTTLALGLSSLVDRLCTIARWDERRGTVRGLDRHEWTWSPEFIEIGGPLIESHLTRRFQELVAIVGGDPTGPPVEVRPDDMRSLTLADEQFDLVIWDPPYYDNVDYERVALPFTRFLRSLIGDLHPQLPWPQDLAADADRPKFDADRYGRDLQAAASEVARVLRPGGRLGVFWIANDDRTAEDLGELLDVLQPNGLELIQSIALRTEPLNPRIPEGRPARLSVFLVFRRTPGARPADAGSVLEGALEGRPVMYTGLVELLLQHLDDEEIEDLIPSGYRGTVEQRLREAVLSQAEPRDLLAGLSKKALRTFVEARAENGPALGRTREELEDEVFSLLGWRVPSEPRFTVGSALDDAERMLSQLRLAATEEDIRGTATAAFDRIEQILRFAVVTWATWLRGEDWAALLVEVVDRKEKLTFGQWLRAFVELPGHAAQESQLIGQVNSRMRRAKVPASLDAVVKVRNAFAHPDTDQADWVALRDEAEGAMHEAIRRLRAADDAGALPQVLQPLRETRDPYGRITLRLLGHRGHVEFLMTTPSDLTQPVVVLPGDTNPREVDPACLPADLVVERAGLG